MTLTELNTIFSTQLATSFNSNCEHTELKKQQLPYGRAVTTPKASQNQGQRVVSTEERNIHRTFTPQHHTKVLI